MQIKKNPVHQQLPLQVIKHWVLGVLNFKGQVIKTRVLGSKPNMAGYQIQKRTDRAKLMNEVLPKFYKACYSKCKDAREFVKLFHCEGRRQYESHQHVSKISTTVDSFSSLKRFEKLTKHSVSHISWTNDHDLMEPSLIEWNFGLTSWPESSLEEKYFRDFRKWPLNRVWQLNAGPLYKRFTVGGKQNWTKHCHIKSTET